MNLREALASLPGGVDRDFARRLLRVAEEHYLAAIEAIRQTTGVHDG